MSATPLITESPLHRSPDLRVYATQSGYSAVTGTRGADLAFFDINETAVDLLRHIDGSRDGSAIVDAFCTTHAVDAAEHAGWITAFLDQLQARRVIGPGVAASEPLRIVGSSDLTRPVHVTLELTDACNLECGHCYLSASPAGRRTMDYDTFVRVAEAFVDQQGLSVELTGGEATLHPDIDEILRYAIDHFAVVGFMTNATHVADSTLEILRSGGPRVTVGVSLDSTRPEVHDRLRGRRGAFDRTVATVRRLSAAGIRVRIGAVLFDENQWELRDLAQLSADLGAALFSFNFLEPLGRGQEFADDHTAHFDAEYRAFLEQAVRDFSGIIPIIPAEQFTGRTNCGAGCGSVTVGPAGDVRPCALFASGARLGNVTTTPWQEVFDQPVFARLGAVPCPQPSHGCPTDCSDLAHCHRCYLKGIEHNAGLSADERCAWVQVNHLHDVVDALYPSAG